MITLPSQKSHALQPLDVACFKPFKIVFRKEKNTTMVRRNYTKLDKIALMGWVDKALDQTFTKKKIMSRFKGTWIWPLNLKAINLKTSLSNIYTL
jgi:hypothetical protein